MAIIKCKMCGGEFTFNPGESIGTCDYCGTKQTLPKAVDENLQGLLLLFSNINNDSQRTVFVIE